MPDMIAVESESLDAVGFDAQRHELYVRFRQSGLTYVYYGVAEHVFQELLRADSKGAFFNARIRPDYEFAKRAHSPSRRPRQSSR